MKRLLFILLLLGCSKEKENIVTIKPVVLHLTESNYRAGIVNTPQHWQNPKNMMIVVYIDGDRCFFIEKCGEEIE